MAETIVASPIVHEVLNPNNYEEWMIRLKYYLIAHNLWDVVKPIDEPSKEGLNVEANGETSEEGPSVTANQGKSEEVNGETSEKGKSAVADEQSVEANDEASKQIESEVEIKKNATALHAIHISCGSDAFSVIKDINSAKEAWKTLTEKYRTDVVPYNCNGEPLKYQDFFEAVRNIEDDWSIVEKILREHPEEDKQIVTSKHRVTGETGLHIAATAGNVNIVKELVKLMPEKDLEEKGTDQFTALTEAVFTGMKSIAECMVLKNDKIVSISDSYKLLPVVHALSYGYNEMANYLYSKTPKEALSPDKDFNNAAALLYWSIDAKNYDIAMCMLNRFPRLAITVHREYESPFGTLAANPAMFRSTRGFNFWQRWIYNRIDTRSNYAASNDICCIHVQNQEDSQTRRKNICCTGLLKWLRSYVRKLLGIEHIREMKLGHESTEKILQKMCKEIKTLDDKDLEKCLVVDALHKATANGMIEFFRTLIEANPELLWLDDKHTGKNLFMVAVEYRQPKIFSLIHGLMSKRAIAALRDSSNNNMLHMAGRLAPSSQLTSIAGPALQMQRELQWFKEVEKVISPSLKELRNSDDETPKELFTKSHKDLMEKGEKWMKETAQSCTVPVALIVTIMFAAIFTVPGGLIQDTGRPLLLHDKRFKIFLVSDILSLFCSTISMTMFLGILSSPYREDDFLRSLPTKMIIGLVTLALSSMGMMTCFSAVFLILCDRDSWIIFSTILSLSFISQCFILQYSLLFEILKSTYGPSIFERNQSRWL